MDRLNLPFFYQLGAALKPVVDMKVESDSGFDLLISGYTAVVQIRSLLAAYPSMAVCKASGEKFIVSMDTAFDQWRKWSALPEDQKQDASPVSNTLMTTVIGNAVEFQTILSAEPQTLAAYHVTEKGIYSTTSLIERASEHLPKSIRDELSTETREDINQAGRCLAFDLPTASGFHTWRAVETVLVMYCKELQAKPKRRDWGSYIAALKAVNADPKTVAILDQIRDLHRNPTMHPEVVLSPDDALGLFGIAPSAIVAMVVDIRRHQATLTPTPALR